MFGLSVYKRNCSWREKPTDIFHSIKFSVASAIPPSIHQSFGPQGTARNYLLEGGLRLECGDPRAVGNRPTGTPGVLGRGGEAVGLRCNGRERGSAQESLLS